MKVKLNKEDVAVAIVISIWVAVIGIMIFVR
jgi:hypothetical protein